MPEGDANAVRDRREEVKMSMPSGNEPTPGPGWLTLGAPERDLRLYLGGMLKQAWGLFSLSRLDEAEATARALAERLEGPATWTASTERDAGENRLLVAAAKTVLGCVAEERGQRDNAEDQFADAVSLYDRCMDRRGARGLAGQDYRFYGIALDRVDRKKEAVVALEKALELGDITLEAYRHLAELYRVMGEDERDPAKLAQGEQFIRKALELSPSSPTSHEVLGKILEAMGRPGEAVDAYLQSVQALSESIGQRLNDVVRLMNRASALAPDDVRVVILRGMTFAAQHRYPEALSALEPALRQSPPDLWALVVAGGIHRNLGDHQESERILRRAVELQPDSVPAWLELAQTLQAAGDREAEIGALNRVLELAPEHVQALVLRGRARFDLARFDEAIADHRRAAELSPQSLWAQTELAESLRLNGRYEEALPVLDRALELNRDDPKLLGIRGLVLRELKRFEEGAADLRRAVAKEPDLIWAHVALAESLARANRHGEALQLLEQALERFPDDGSLLRTKVDLLKSQDQDVRVMLTLQKVLDRRPDLVWAHIELALVLCRMDFADEAMESIGRAFALGPGDPRTLLEALTVKGKISCAVGNYRAAIEVLNEALQHAPRAHDLYGVRGWALENLEPTDARGALESYEKALEYDPNDPWWHKGRANALRFLGQDDDAAAEYRWVLDWARRLEQRPHPEVLSLIGWCHYSIGDYDAAVELIGKAVSQKPSLVSDQFDFALALMCRKNHVFALREYRKGVEMSEYKPVSRRCGLFRVALRDLRFAAKKVPLSSRQAAEAESLLTRCLEAAEAVVAVSYRQSIECSIDLDVPIENVFFRLSQFESYPTFVTWVNRVWRLDERRLRWDATIGNSTPIWDVEILEMTPYARISWQSGSPDGHALALTLFPSDQGTRLRVRIAFNDVKHVVNLPDPAGVLKRLLSEALAAFKRHIECRDNARPDPAIPV